MIISESNVQMSSQRAYSRKLQHRRTTFMWNADNSQKTVSSQTATSRLSTEEHYGLGYYPSYNRFGQMDDTSSVSSSDAAVDNVRGNYETLSMTFLRLIEMIRNARFKLDVTEGSYWSSLTGRRGISDVFSITSSSTPAVWNRVTQDSYSYEENESTSFCAEGTAITADGRSISFDVTMKMSRSFKQQLDFECFDSFSQVLTDPLVINLNSNPVSISDKTFFFDLDCDGKDEEIAELSKGCGYLALDINGDGKINNGSELFGPSTGNGFDELAKYDSDNNGWIDEADEIFDKLKVWTTDENGNSVLLLLKEADVGAINLGSSKTDFSLKNQGDLRGMVRSTGFYLKESGGSGTVQQVDF